MFLFGRIICKNFNFLATKKKISIILGTLKKIILEKRYSYQFHWPFDTVHVSAIVIDNLKRYLNRSLCISNVTFAHALKEKFFN